MDWLIFKHLSHAKGQAGPLSVEVSASGKHQETKTCVSVVLMMILWCCVAAWTYKEIQESASSWLHG